MATKGDDGVSLRDHLTADAEGLFPNPVSVARLAAEPRLPALAAPVWARFLELHLRRPQTEFGPLRLPWSEVEAYSRVMGVSVKRWQLSAIFALEEAFFEVRAEAEKAKPKKK